MSAITALSIPLVLENVFRNLSNKDLARCRLAGPKNSWNRAACQLLDQRLLLKLKPTENLTEIGIVLESSIQGISICPSRLLIEMESTQQELYYETQQGEMLEAELRRFCQTVKHQVNELKLHVTFHKSNVLLESMVFNLFPNLIKCEITISFFKETTPSSELKAENLAKQGLLGMKSHSQLLTNLKEVNLTVGGMAYRGRPMMGWVECLHFTAKLLSSAPNLECFLLKLPSYFISPRNSYLEQFEHSLTQIYTTNFTSAQLKNITLIQGHISGEQLRSLYNPSMRFHLESFRLENVDTTTVTISDITEFLNEHRSTLQRLHLVFSGNTKMLNFPFGASLDKLKYFKLGRFDGSIDWKLFPKLKELCLPFCGLSEIVSSIVASPAICLPSSFKFAYVMNETMQSELKEYCPQYQHGRFLTSLDKYRIRTDKLLQSKNSGEDELLAKFIQVAPCLGSDLTSLTLKYGFTAPLALIFGECRLLKTLRLIECKGLNDDALCGVLEKTLQNVTWPEDQRSSNEGENLDKYYKQLVEQAIKAHLEMDRPLPCIGDLKDLQSFSALLHKKEKPCNNILSDVSLLHGIIHCKKLKTLQLYSKNLNPTRAAHIIQYAGLQHLSTCSVNSIDTFELLGKNEKSVLNQ